MMLRQESRAGACGHGEEFVLFLSELSATEGWRQRKDRTCLGFYQDLSVCGKGAIGRRWWRERLP